MPPGCIWAARVFIACTYLLNITRCRPKKDSLIYNESMFAQVAVNFAQADGPFHYRIPSDLEGEILPGHLVRVPFGPRMMQGVVLRLDAHAPVETVKPLDARLDAQPVMQPGQLLLLEQMAADSLMPLGALLPLFLPPGLGQQADLRYHLSAMDESVPADLKPAQRRLWQLLQEKGPLRARQISRRMPRDIWQPAMRGLIRRGLVRKEYVLPAPNVHPKIIRTAQLAVPPERARQVMPSLSRHAAVQKRRQAALEFLIHEPQPVDVTWVYAASGCNLTDLRRLAEQDLVILRETEIWRDPLAGMAAENAADESEPPNLTADQQSVLDALLQAFQNPSDRHKPFLLEGVTASGKTEIYLQAVARVLQSGRDALVLVPEIALTPQIVRRFMRRFPGQVGLLHSRLSDGERYDTWRRARAGLLKVIIGPRSALFAPLPDVGLIVLDECHDASYHQSEPPAYDARQAATRYAAIQDALCLLGSATPSVVQRYRARRGVWVDLRLPERVAGGALPSVRIVDMRAELHQGNRGIFSRPLHESLAEVLSRGEQAILYLNRRGAATYVFCRDCGHVLTCPRCDTPLTYHQSDAHGLRCHHCGYTRRMPKTCPECGSTHIRQYGLGTERVEQEVQRLFPDARTLRWDADAVRGKNAHDLILEHFSAGRADVLIGTQMLAKGLDVPRVTLVGVVLADVGLNLPDPFAGERSFQLLTQVSGRAGRSSLGGQVILQTYQPEHYVLQAASRHDVDGFYQQELAYRRRMGYPPFARLLRLEYRDRDADRASRRAAALGEQIAGWIQAESRSDISLIGPAPCFFARLDGWYRWQIVLRGPDPVSFLRGRLPSGWRVDVDPTSLL